jgi:hypothetical protein
MKKNIASTALKYVIVDLIGDILYFPLWWYSRGLADTAIFCWHKIQQRQEKLGLSIWINNLFTPMFGQYDFEGRLISFLVRLIQIILRSIFLLFYVIAVASLVIVWIIIPPVIIYYILDNFSYLFHVNI